MSTGINLINEFMSEETHQTLTKRYDSVLNRAKVFLGSKGTSKGGGGASDARKKTLVDANADCPQCGLRFVGMNHNTEHIHPKALGGGRSDSTNRIQMCRMCNNARASTMTSFIGTPPYFKKFPSNWPRIEAFMLWSELTIDDGLDAGVNILEVHELFIEARFAGAKPIGAKPSRAYDRFSTWAAGDDPNYPHNSSRLVSAVAPPPINKPPSAKVNEGGEAMMVATPTIRSFLARKAQEILDFIFDYEPKKEENIPNQTNDLNESATVLTSVEPVFDKDALLEKWRSFVALQIWSNTGEMMLGDFWDMVIDAKISHGTGWRAFERVFGLTHKSAMPVKASNLLQQMGYVFSFQKTDNGYKIIFNTEEE